MPVDHDLEWSVGVDSNLQWRMGYEPFRKLRAPTVDGLGMEERCRGYNGGPPGVGAKRQKCVEEVWMGDDFGWCEVTKA